MNCFFVEDYIKGTKSRSAGYAKLKRNYITVYAHRHVWTVCFGDIPNGMEVMHTCDNKLCVNPEHLVLGTRKDNTIDAVKKGRMANQKLSDEQVKEIRNSKEMGVVLAKKYKVSPQLITNLRNRHCRKHF